MIELFTIKIRRPVGRTIFVLIVVTLACALWASGHDFAIALLVSLAAVTLPADVGRRFAPEVRS